MRSPNTFGALHGFRKVWSLLTSALGFAPGNPIEGNVTGDDSSLSVTHPLREIARSIPFSGPQDKYDAVENALGELPKGPAAEIGCGKGRSLLVLARLGFEPLYGIDLSPTSIESSRSLLRSSGTQCQLLLKDAVDLSNIPDDSLALIYCRNTFQYLDHAPVAASFHRALRSGGYLVMEAMGLGYYLWNTRLKNLFSPDRYWTLLSYPRVVVRTFLYRCCGKQLLLGSTAPEMGCTLNVIERFANLVNLQIISVGPAPSLPGYLCILRKPVHE